MIAPGPCAPTVSIEIVYALPEVQHVLRLELPTGATVLDALHGAAGHEPFAHLDLPAQLAAGRVGLFGERVTGGEVLNEHDRVEIYRSLVMDPRDARRRRAARR